MNETLGYAYADTAIGTVIVVSDATGICMVDYFGRTMVAGLPENIKEDE